MWQPFNFSFNKKNSTTAVRKPSSTEDNDKAAYKQQSPSSKSWTNNRHMDHQTKPHDHQTKPHDHQTKPHDHQTKPHDHQTKPQNKALSQSSTGINATSNLQKPTEGQATQNGTRSKERGNTHLIDNALPSQNGTKMKGISNVHQFNDVLTPQNGTPKNGKGHRLIDAVPAQTGTLSHKGLQQVTEAIPSQSNNFGMGRGRVYQETEITPSTPSMIRGRHHRNSVDHKHRAAPYNKRQSEQLSLSLNLNEENVDPQSQAPSLHHFSVQKRYVGFGSSEKTVSDGYEQYEKSSSGRSSQVSDHGSPSQIGQRQAIPFPKTTDRNSYRHPTSLSQLGQRQSSSEQMQNFAGANSFPKPSSDVSSGKSFQPSRMSPKHDESFQQTHPKLRGNSYGSHESEDAYQNSHNSRTNDIHVHGVEVLSAAAVPQLPDEMFNLNPSSETYSESSFDVLDGAGTAPRQNFDPETFTIYEGIFDNLQHESGLTAKDIKKSKKVKILEGIQKVNPFKKLERVISGKIAEEVAKINQSLLELRLDVLNEISHDNTPVADAAYQEYLWHRVFAIIAEKVTQEDKEKKKGKAKGQPKFKDKLFQKLFDEHDVEFCRREKNIVLSLTPNEEKVLEVMEILQRWKMYVHRRPNKMEILLDALRDIGLTDVEEIIKEKCRKLNTGKEKVVMNDLSLRQVSKKIGKKRRELGTHLGYTPEEVENFELNSSSVEDAIFTMLADWRDRSLGNNQIKIGRLCSILRAAGCHSAAQVYH